MSTTQRQPADIDALLTRMTLEEMVAQIVCAARIPEASWLVDEAGHLDADALLERFPDGVGQLGRPSQKLDPVRAVQLTNEIQKALQQETRLRIPALFNEEGIHGLMGTGATSYPVPIALASMWDLELTEQLFAAVARETRARGSNYVYAPVLDLALDARWGRFEETFGEDPFLVSRMGVAAVNGLQGPDWTIPSDKVLACAKHFAGHGTPEAGANAAPLHAGERELRERHLVPFEAAVSAGVGALMAAYHEIDGIPCHSNEWLLIDVLRDEWGFEGVVSSDGFGVVQLAEVHHVAADEAEAARIAIASGVDAEVPEPRCFSTLVEQVRAGKVAQQTVERAVRRVLNAKDRLGLLGGVDPVDRSLAEAMANHPDHRALALEAARRSCTLLKNDGPLLPLDQDSTRVVAVIGPNAADVHLGGYADDPGVGVSVLDGIATMLGAERVLHAEGCRITEGPQGAPAWWGDEVMPADPTDQDDRIAEAVKSAESADVAVLVIGGNEATAREAWWYDHLGDRASLTLPGRQVDLIEAVAGTGVPVVAVVMGGRPLDLRPVVRHSSAVLQVWYPGQEGGTAIAEILFGEVNPSGKLPVTFPRSVGHIPLHAGRPPSAGRGYLFADNTPLFPFGHGLSYTTFEYGEPMLDTPEIAAGDDLIVRIDVTNTGDRYGHEVVQCYLHDLTASVTRPRLALCGFVRVGLGPGERTTATFRLTGRDMALVDRALERTIEPGAFDVLIGGSSATLQAARLTVC